MRLIGIEIAALRLVTTDSMSPDGENEEAHRDLRLNAVVAQDS